MMAQHYSISSLSDRAALVSFGNSIDPLLNDRVLWLHGLLLQHPPEGFIESVPAYASLAVVYDPQKIRRSHGRSAFGFIRDQLAKLIERGIGEQAPPGKTVQVPVCYDPEFGPDLKQLAAERQLSIDELTRLHSSVTYRVYMIGFLPGFPYMGTLPALLHCARKDDPRMRVPAGSVAIAGAQTGIYPVDSPGGWQLIGKTLLKLFNPGVPSPCLLAAGDRVQFVPVERAAFEATNVN